MAQVLTQSIGTALASGQFNRVPIINGTNHDEERLFVAIGLSINFGHTTVLQDPPITAANYQATDRVDTGRLRRHRGGHRGAVPAQRLLEPAGRLQRTRHRRELRLSRPPDGQVDIQVRADVRLRVQRRERPGAVPAAGQLPVRGSARIRAAVPLRPAEPADPFPGTLTAQQQQLAASMQHYWTNFAAQGSPVFGRPADCGRPSAATASRCSRWYRRSHRSRRTSPRSTTARSGLPPHSPCTQV